MQMTYNEVVDRLNELNLVIKAYEATIHTSKLKWCKYMNVPLGILNQEMESLKAKIEDLKSNAIVTYDNDTTYLEKLLENPDCESEEWKMDNLKDEIILLNKNKLCENLMQIVALNKSVTEILNKLSNKEEVHFNEFQICITKSLQIFHTTNKILEMMKERKVWKMDNEMLEKLLKLSEENGWNMEYV